MKRLFKTFILFLILTSCNDEKQSIFISSDAELVEILRSAKKGDNFILKNGIYKDVNIQFVGQGTANEPITLSA